MRDAPLHIRFEENLRKLEWDGDAEMPWLVAVSGGLDSVVLLHLLRFGASLPADRIVVGHFDHGMRVDSGGDAAWVRGVCRSWSLRLETGATTLRLRNEAEARAARYAFLEGAAERTGTRLIVTAHHADDQAETVLFRILRGTGIEGLRGIPARSPSGLLRPLLPFWRKELEDYARLHRLRWRQDPTNLELGATRNRIRRELLPDIERSVAPGARRNLVRLAELAAESEAGWGVRLEGERARAVRREGEAYLVARQELRGYDPATATRLVREVLQQLGSVPGRIGTRSALQFITHAPSGRELQLPGGVRIRTEFEVARIELEPVGGEHRPIELPEIAAGESFSTPVTLGGRRWRVDGRITIGLAGGGADPDRRASVPIASLRLPLCLRDRRPGDRIGLRGGFKSLKKLMIERRVPRSERICTPVLVDADGRVLWVVGVAHANLPEPLPEEPALELTVYDDPDG